MSENHTSVEPEGTPMILLSGGGALMVMAVTLAAMVAGVLLAIHVSGGAGSPQVIEVTMGQGKFTPALLVADAGKPLEIKVLRTEGGRCTRSVVMEGFGIKRILNEQGVTIIRFTPERAGNYPFHCGMGCLKGVLKVRDA